MNVQSSCRMNLGLSFLGNANTYLSSVHFVHLYLIFIDTYNQMAFWCLFSILWLFIKGRFNIYFNSFIAF